MTEWNAAGYAMIAGLQVAMADEVLGLLTLKGDERVLDLGCGNGKVTATIAARVPQGSVLGVDASAEMIALSAQQFPPPQYPNLHFQTGDIRRLDFREEFDLVVSFNALHWIPEQEKALRGIRAAMKSDAVAQLRLVPAGRRKSLETVLEETRQSADWAGYFQQFRDPYLRLTQEQYAELAEQNGLRVLDIHTADKCWDFQSEEGFRAFGSVTFVEWTKVLPEDRRGAFVADVLRRYRLEVADGPGEENTFKFYQMDVRLARA